MEKYGVLGERLKKKFAKEVIDYYHKPKPKLTKFDALIQINKAHVVMLYEQGIIEEKDGSEILKALIELEENGEEKFEIDPYLGDLYMNMEAYIVRRIGEDVGGKMHTARSRNDLFPCQSRIVARSRINEIMDGIIKLRGTLLRRAEEHIDTLMPGYTHLQHAQPITLGHYLVAMADMFERDLQRLEGSYKRVDLNPLGACALATTGFPIDRKRTSELMGFNGLIENSVDAVCSEDFSQEVISALAIFLTNLSRFAMDLVLWSSYEYGFIEIADQFASISSIMPQKKNPVMAEAMRGSVSRVLGCLERIHTALKSIPHCQSRDRSEASEALINAIDESYGITNVAIGVVSTLIVNKVNMEKGAGTGFSTATELADTIVRERDLSFRSAHRIVGMVVSLAIEQGLEVCNVTSNMIDEAAKEIVGRPLNLDDEMISKALDPYENILRRDVMGGPAPQEVKRMIRDRKRKIREEKSHLEKRRESLEEADKELTKAVYQILRRSKSYK